MNKPAKLSRNQIREGLNTIPLDSLLLGSQSKEKTLTSKQREFARQVALGETKADAYRKAYNSKGKAKTAGNAGSLLAKHSGIAMEVQAYQAAIEASKHRTPSALRELVIHQLTKHALDDDVPPAQRIKSLELLGKVSEVAAFTERKETTVINQSGDIKAKLMQTLSKFMQSPNQSITDLSINPKTCHDLPSIDQGDDLLAELAGYASPDPETEQPTPTPPASEGLADGQGDTHTISHTESPKNIHTNPTNKLDESNSHLQVIDSKGKDTLSETSFRREGVGDVEYSEIEYEVVQGEVPPCDSELKV